MKIMRAIAAGLAAFWDVLTERDWPTNTTRIVIGNGRKPPIEISYAVTDPQPVHMDLPPRPPLTMGKASERPLFFHPV